MKTYVNKGGNIMAILVKRYLQKEKTYMYVQSVISDDQIHAVQQKSEAKQFKKDNKLLKTMFADTTKWERDYI